MRLLNTTTGRFHWFEDPHQVRYAILSHVWSKDTRKPEQSYQDVQLCIDSAVPGKSILEDPSLSDKIRSFCRVAQEHGFDFGWVDSCCIDRTSSSELSEALTSMYDWYRCADLCLAFLHDVHVSSNTDASKRDVQFRSSLWFLRGWTLQELLAPSILLFLSSTWDVIGSKQTSAALVASVTNIDQDVLTFKRSLRDVSVACKMSWAASRRTTREEDEAYCLMGIFGVSIPIMYGEGRYAFVRLQEEVIRTIPDQSIFAWGRILRAPQVPFQFCHPDDSAVASAPHPPPAQYPSSNQYVLASSPRDFEASSSIIHLSRDQFAETLGMSPESTYQVFTVTAHGIHVQLPLVVVISKDLHEMSPTYLALLACETQHDGNLLALLLRSQDDNAGPGFLVGAGAGNLAQAAAGILGASDLKDWHYRAVYLSIRDVERIRRRRLFRMADIYVPHRPSPDASETKRDQRIFRSIQELQHPFDVVLSGWSRSLLSLDGSRVLEPDKDEDSIVLRDRFLSVYLTPGVVISYKAIHINIQIGHCKCSLDRRFQVVPGVLVWSPHAESSLEQRYKDVPHLIDHPVHIHSWAFRDGVASTSVDLRPFSSPRERITVRLTLYQPSDQSSTQAYRLGVEVTSSQVDVQLSSSVPSRLRNYRAMVYDPTLGHSSLGGGDLQTKLDMLSDSLPLPVRGRTRSRSFSAPYTVEPYDLTPEDGKHKHLMTESPDDEIRVVQLPESPPITATNSGSSDYPANDWHGSLPRRYAPPSQEPPNPSPRRSSTWNTSPQFHNGGQAWLPRSRRHSFEDSGIQSSYASAGPRGPFIYARDDLSVVSRGIASTGQRPWFPQASARMLGDSVTRTYAMDLRDVSTRLRSSEFAGRTFDEKGNDSAPGPLARIPAVVRAGPRPSTPLAQGDPSLEASNFRGRGQHRGVRSQTFQGRVGNGAEQTLPFVPGVGSEPGEPLRGRQVELRRSDSTRQARARSVPRPGSPPPPDMGQGWLPRALWDGRGHSPSWPDVMNSNIPPPAPPEGRTQMNQHPPVTATMVGPSNAPVEAPFSDRRGMLSTSPPWEHGGGLPSLVPVAQDLTMARGRDGGGDCVGLVLDGPGSALSSTSQPFRDTSIDGAAPRRAVAPSTTRPVAAHGTGPPAEGGPRKEKGRMSGFVRRLPFLKRKFASESS